MIAMADQNQRAPFARKFKSFQVHLRHQRASGINDAQLPLLRFRADPRWHPVSAENKHSADRNFINGFHEDCAAAPQLIHHIAVMNDFMMNVNRAAVSFERELYDVHRANHARTESARPDAHQRLATVRRALYIR